jgi:hypothetical protein
MNAMRERAMRERAMRERAMRERNMKARAMRGVTIAIGVAAVGAAAGCGGQPSGTAPGVPDASAPGAVEDAGPAAADGDPAAAGACSPRTFGELVVVDPRAGAPVQAAVDTDLVPLLARVAGRPFRKAASHDGACPALWVVRAEALAAHAPPSWVQAAAAPLDKAAAQAYVIAARRGQGAWIVARTDRGLVHGIYDVLERAGVRFLLPGEDWTVAPPRADLSFDASELREPSFRTVDWFGTGGFGPGTATFPIAGLGAGGQVQRDLATWQRRSRFPHQYALGGHTWEAFVATASVRAQLQADPALRACVRCADTDTACLARPEDATCGDRPSGRYRRVAATASTINPTHHGLTLCGAAAAPRACGAGEAPTLEDPADFSGDAGLAGLYGRWSLERLRGAAAAAAADPSLEPVVSVDPADGAGFCRCDKCRNMLRNGAEGVRRDQDATVTDAIFHLANHVARRAAGEHRGSAVNLYSYASRADVPQIPLEPNVLVVLVPYAFHSQYTGKTADEMIQGWVEKRAANPRGRFRMAVYDYWTIPDWSWDQPDLALARVGQRLAAWRAAGIEAISNESTYGLGPLGVHWFVVSRLAWDASLDVDAAARSWFADAFGVAAPPVERMYRRFWTRGWSANALDLSEALASMKEADALAPAEGPVRRRLAAVQGYVEYLRLLYEHRAQPRNVEALDALLAHVWRLGPTGMVHAYRIWQLLMRGHPQPDRWAFRSRTDHGPAWAAVVAQGPLTPAEMRRRTAEAAEKYPPAGLVPESNPFTGPLVPLEAPTPAPMPAPAPAPAEIDVTDGGLGDEWGGQYVFHAVAGQPLTITLGVTGRGYGIPDGRLTVRDPGGEVVLARKVPVPTNGKRLEPIELAPTKTGAHRLDYSAGYTEFHELRYPRTLPLVRVAPTDFSWFVPGRTHWFYVPRGTRRFAYITTCNNAPAYPIFRGPAGPVTARWQGPVAILDVPPGQDAAPWSLAGYCASARFANLPNYLAYRREQLLVPSDALAAR